MAKGKGGESTQEIKLPPELMKAAKIALADAASIGKLPPMHNFGGTVAAFSPQQVAAMGATDQAAGSLGLPTAGFGTGPNTGMNVPGMPAAQNFGGHMGYSTEGVFNDAMSRVPPAVRKLYDAWMTGGSPAGGIGGAAGGTGVPGLVPAPINAPKFAYDPDRDGSYDVQYSRWKRNQAGRGY